MRRGWRAIRSFWRQLKAQALGAVVASLELGGVRSRRLSLKRFLILDRFRFRTKPRNISTSART